MAVSRGEPPPVNLKERIAALQQRSVSPNTHQSAQTQRSLPSPGSGGLRDRIAKFEGKGGVPVPRGSFAMGAPQLAENAPPKKRGEFYANRVPGLGRPTGPPLADPTSRAGSPAGISDNADASPSPRKRCISTGASLSNAPSTTSVTNEPVPPLPNSLSSSAPRRNSLAVNFGSGRRVMSTNDAEGKAVVEFADETSPSSTSLVPEKLPVEFPPCPEEVTLEDVPSTEPEALNSEALEPSGSIPIDRQPPPAPPSPSTPEVDVGASASEPPTAKPIRACETSRNGALPTTIKLDCEDEPSDYESSLQSSASQPSPLASPPDALPVALKSTESVIVSPPTPPSEETTKPDAGSRASIVTISVPNPTIPEMSSTPTPDPTTDSPSRTKSTFKAVVHRKVTEISVPPVTSSLAPPAVPQLTHQRNSDVSVSTAELPSSPGVGDLALLLEDAALLELRLTEPDGPGPKRKELLATTPTNASFQQDRRHASASTVTEHTPLPSVDGGSQSGRSVSIPSIREPLLDGEIPEGDETDGRSLASTTFSQRSPSTHRKYLSNIYRLTSRRSSSYMPGTYPRDSMSLSSEDSSPVTTPSDNGKRKGFGIAWPTASPKNGGPNVSRSSSFADKIFNRNRTKSNVSTVDPVAERTSLYETSQPTLSLTFPSELPPEGHPDSVNIHGGARSTSWISPRESNSEFSPASSLLDKDLFDAFPSVPQTLPPGFHLDAGNTAVGRASTLPVNGRKQVNQRLSMM